MQRRYHTIVEKLLRTLGSVTAIIGAQWGDEGKGKIVDILASHFDIIARASGGSNAGHTIEVENEKHVFHLLPSGCLHEGKDIVLGNAMVLHLPTLLSEIKLLEETGTEILSRLHISHTAHVVFDYHQKVDGVVEERRPSTSPSLRSGLPAYRQAGAQDNKFYGKGIGTTKRGIGPAYADKAYRTGLRMGDLISMDEPELKRVFQHHASFVHKMFDLSVNAKNELQKLSDAKKLLKSRVTDTVSLLHIALREKKRILIEGAQGTFLDIDHGTYPYVTSSATTAAGALHGLGLPPQALTSCIGIVKAYCTRVGEGPFPAEAESARADILRERGNEYGATTGRPRRCGWLSIGDVKRAAAMNGFTHLNLTKLDVLDREAEIPVSVSDHHSFETNQGKKLQWKNLPGWRESTEGKTKFTDLPENAQEYVKFIEKKTGIPVSFIGTGPGREEMIVR